MSPSSISNSVILGWISISWFISIIHGVERETVPDTSQPFKWNTDTWTLEDASFGAYTNCPSGGKCIRLSGTNSQIWKATMSTIGYHTIKAEWTMRTESLADNADINKCKLFSIVGHETDDNQYINRGKFASDSQVTSYSVSLPDTGSKALVGIWFYLHTSDSGACYINDFKLTGVQITPPTTADPTGDPTLSPFATTDDPTLSPITTTVSLTTPLTTQYPTLNPSRPPTETSYVVTTDIVLGSTDVDAIALSSKPVDTLWFWVVPLIVAVVICAICCVGYLFLQPRNKAEVIAIDHMTQQMSTEKTGDEQKTAGGPDTELVISTDFVPALQTCDDSFDADVDGIPLPISRPGSLQQQVSTPGMDTMQVTKGGSQEDEEEEDASITGEINTVRTKDGEPAPEPMDLPKKEDCRKDSMASESSSDSDGIYGNGNNDANEVTARGPEADNDGFGKCTQMNCACTEYVKPTSKWSKNQCKTCNHKVDKHKHEALQTAGWIQ